MMKSKLNGMGLFCLLFDQANKLCWCQTLNFSKRLYSIGKPWKSLAHNVWSVGMTQLDSRLIVQSVDRIMFSPWFHCWSALRLTSSLFSQPVEFSVNSDVSAWLFLCAMAKKNVNKHKLIRNSIVKFPFHFSFCIHATYHFSLGINTIDCSCFWFWIWIHNSKNSTKQSQLRLFTIRMVFYSDRSSWLLAKYGYVRLLFDSTYAMMYTACVHMCICVSVSEHGQCLFKDDSEVCLFDKPVVV